MKKVIIHWTAGANKPNATDLEHYHFVIDSTGKVHNGKYKVADNEDCSDGKYAAHCGGGNTGAIGVSMCGMAGFNGKPESTKYPLTLKQCETCWSHIAQLCKQYNIPITKTTVMTHYEFGQAHVKTSSYGKIDITYLHPYPTETKQTLGDFIRNKVRWYYQRLN